MDALKDWIKKQGMAIVLALILVGLIVFWMTRPEPGPAIDLRAVEQQIRKKYDDQMEVKNKEIGRLMSKLADAEGRYRASLQQIAQIKEKIDNVEEPQTRNELADRFDRLGYPVLSGNSSRR